MTNKGYYRRQLKRVNTNSYYPLKIKVSGNGEQTNYMDINKATADVVIEWLNKNYIEEKKLTLAELKRNNKAAGQFFFSKDTMKFFGPQTCSIVKNCKTDHVKEKNESDYILKIKFLRDDSIKLYSIIDRGNSINSIN